MHSPIYYWPLYCFSLKKEKKKSLFAKKAPLRNMKLL